MIPYCCRGFTFTNESRWNSDMNFGLVQGSGGQAWVSSACATLRWAKMPMVRMPFAFGMFTSDHGTKNSALQPLSVRAVAPHHAPSQLKSYWRGGRMVPSDLLSPRLSWNQKP